jgi:hypothetical protein
VVPGVVAGDGDARSLAMRPQVASTDRSLRSAAARTWTCDPLQRPIPQVVGLPRLHLVEKPGVDTASPAGLVSGAYGYPRAEFTTVVGRWFVFDGSSDGGLVMNSMRATATA